MKFSNWNRFFLVLVLTAETLVFTSTQEPPAPCDLRCKTGVCNLDGSCHCVRATLGDPLNFLGGQFCDQPSHYCSESADLSFWCVDNNSTSTCGRKEDGTPTCICQLGYGGDRCEFAGTPCGVGYCYNNATCVDGKSCDCPLGWQGNANCTMATPMESSSGSGIKWWGGLLITGAVVAALSVAVAFGLKKYKEKMDGVNRFNELKKSQMRGGAESDDDDAYDSDPYEEAGKRSRTAPQL